MRAQLAHHRLDGFADVERTTASPFPNAKAMSIAIRRAVFKAESASLHARSMENRMSVVQETTAAFADSSSGNPDSPSADDISAEVKHMITVVAGQRTWDDTRESWLNRAAWKLGMPYARVRRLFYEEVQRIPADEYLRIKAAVRVAAS